MMDDVRKFITNPICVGVIGILSVGACVAESSPNDSAVHEKSAIELATESSIAIGEGQVTGTLHRYLLVKKGRHACAMKFTSLRRDYDAKRPSRISSGEENTYAEYEWLYQEDGSGDFSKSNAMAGKGKLHSGPAYGIGFDITFWRSPDKWWIECGPIKLLWSYPTTLTFVSYNNGASKRDPEVEIAPTNWSQVKEIDINNPKLPWAKLNTGLQPRPDVRIPLSDLP